MLGDTGTQEMFLKIRENESPFLRYDEEGFELEEDISTSIRSSFVQITPRQSDEVNSDKASVEVVPSKRRRVNTALRSIFWQMIQRNRRSASRIFNQKLIERLCSKLCPELLSEDVLNNSSFVDSVASMYDRSSPIRNGMKITN